MGDVVLWLLGPDRIALGFQRRRAIRKLFNLNPRNLRSPARVVFVLLQPRYRLATDADVQQVAACRKVSVKSGHSFLLSGRFALLCGFPAPFHLKTPLPPKGKKALPPPFRASRNLRLAGTTTDQRQSHWLPLTVRVTYRAFLPRGDSTAPLVSLEC